MKLIDKDALVVEIDRREGLLDLDNPLGIGGMVNLEYLKGIINSLEVKEVDLQEEPKTDWLQELQKRLDSLSKEDFEKVIAKYSKYDGEEEPVSEDLNTVAKVYADNITDKVGYKLQLRRAVVYGAKWLKQRIMKDAVEATVTDIRTYKEENEVDFTIMLEKGIIPYELEQEVKLIIVNKED